MSLFQNGFIYNTLAHQSKKNKASSQLHFLLLTIGFISICPLINLKNRLISPVWSLSSGGRALIENCYILVVQIVMSFLIHNGFCSGCTKGNGFVNQLAKWFKFLL